MLVVAHIAISARNIVNDYCQNRVQHFVSFFWIQFGNGFVHQASHVFSFNGVLHGMRQTAYFADDWRRDKMLLATSDTPKKKYIRNHICAICDLFFIQTEITLEVN
jgi:hypothetical protein